MKKIIVSKHLRKQQHDFLDAHIGDLLVGIPTTNEMENTIHPVMHPIDYLGNILKNKRVSSSMPPKYKNTISTGPRFSSQGELSQNSNTRNKRSRKGRKKNKSTLQYSSNETKIVGASQENKKKQPYKCS